MKDILNVIRFDFLCVSGTGFKAWCITAIACLIFSLVISPFVGLYLTFGAIFMIFPLNSIAEKSGFNKLYGILPVKPKNITRGRFWYTFSVFLISELTEFGILLLAQNLKLYRFLPNQQGEVALMIAKSFEPGSDLVSFIVGVSAFACTAFLYMGMMNQIFGTENEMKILGISTIVLVGVSYGTLWLANHEIIPMVNWDTLTRFVSDNKTLLLIGVHFVVLGLCILFGEITAGVCAKREL